MKVCVSRICNVFNWINYIQSKKLNSLSLLLPMMFNWMDVTINDRDEVWRWLQRIFEIIWIGQKYIFNKKTAYLAFTSNGWLNWCKNKWEWCSLKASALTILNYSNRTNIAFNWIEQVLLHCCFQWCWILLM